MTPDHLRMRTLPPMRTIRLLVPDEHRIVRPQRPASHPRMENCTMIPYPPDDDVLRKRAWDAGARLRLADGTRVRHPVYGLGTVHHPGETVTAVTFDSGTIAGVWNHEITKESPR